MARLTLPQARPIATLLALVLAVPRAQAIGLGEAIVHSYIGTPLSVEIPLRLGPGENVDDRCITVGSSIGGSADPLNGIPLTLRVVQGARPHLLIETQKIAREPFASLRIRSECGGSLLSRDYAVLLDPAPALAASTMPGATYAASAGTTAELPPAREGASMAAADPAPAAARAPVPAPAVGQAPRHRPTPPRPVAAPGGHDRLRLDSASAQAHPPETGLTSVSLFRLDTHLAAPGQATPALETQRARMRELQAMMMSGEDTLEHLIALQSRLASLEGQLKQIQGLTGSAPAPAAAAPVAAAPAAAPVASAPAAAAVASAPAAAPASALATTPSAPLPAGPSDADTQVKRVPPPPPMRNTAVPAAPPAEDFDWTLPLAGVGVLLLGGAAAIMYKRRRTRGVPMEDDPDLMPESGAEAGLDNTFRDSVDFARSRPVAERVGKTEPSIGGGRGKPAEPEETSEQATRTAYLAQRFPEIAAGLIRLDDLDSVVSGARLYVESGDHDRAEELLQTAIQTSGGNDVRPWLGLFEVLRLRKQPDAYAAVLIRFEERFGKSRYLPEVLAVGRQIDPHRPEFALPPGAKNQIEISADGTTWLNPELDFVPQALAQDLHDTLMAELEDDPLALSSTGGGRK